MNSALKYKIPENIVKSEDDVLLNEINSLLNISEKVFFHDLPYGVKSAIRTANTELDNGEGIPHQQVMAEIKERYRKQ